MKSNWRVYGMLALCLSGAVAAQTPVTPEKIQGPSDARVLLEWDASKVTELDFESDVRRIPEVNRYEYRQSEKRINELLQSLMVNRSLAVMARKAGIDQDPLVRREIEIATERLLASKYILAYQEKLVMPDFDGLAREYYQVHQAEYQIPESVRASHILIDTKKRGNEEAKRLAQEVKAKLAAGADFAQMVKEFSDDPTAKGNGGSLGSFGKGRMVKEFETAAFAMTTPGQISDVIRTQFGYHIIRYEGRSPAGIKPYDEVKTGLYEKFRKKALSDRTTELLAQVRQNPTLKRDEKAIEALRTKPIMTPAAK